MRNLEITQPWVIIHHSYYKGPTLQPLPVFTNTVLLECSYPPFIYIFSVAAFMSQGLPPRLCGSKSLKYLFIGPGHSLLSSGLALPSYCCCNTSASNNADWLSHSSGGQKSKIGLRGLKSRCRQGCIHCGGAEGESFSWPFPVSRSCQHSLACSPFFRLHNSSVCSQLPSSPPP